MCMNEQKNKEQELSFEQAFGRLEEILEKLNGTNVALEEALKLYEEADSLIIQCHKRLTFCEKKIELLMKNRAQELMTDPNGKPMTQEFQFT